MCKSQQESGFFVWGHAGGFCATDHISEQILKVTLMINERAIRHRNRWVLCIFLTLDQTNIDQIIDRLINELFCSLTWFCYCCLGTRSSNETKRNDWWMSSVLIWTEVSVCLKGIKFDKWWDRFKNTNMFEGNGLKNPNILVCFNWSHNCAPKMK